MSKKLPLVHLPVKVSEWYADSKLRHYHTRYRHWTWQFLKAGLPLGAANARAEDYVRAVACGARRELGVRDTQILLDTIRQMLSQARVVYTRLLAKA